MRLRATVAAALISILSTSAAMAGTDGPLAPGKPAGVRQAQENGHTMLIIAGVTLAGIGIALAASSNGGGPTASTTSATGTP